MVPLEVDEHVVAEVGGVPAVRAGEEGRSGGGGRAAGLAADKVLVAEGVLVGALEIGGILLLLGMRKISNHD